MNFKHQYRTITLDLPIYNPKPLLPYINSYTKFEEKGQKMLNKESGIKMLMDRRTLKCKILNGGYNI